MVTGPVERRETPLVPVPDRSVEARQNIPYRGTEHHGVAGERWTDVPPNETTAVVFEPEPPEQEPIPVRVVTESARERVLWRGLNVPVADMPTRVVGGHETRRSLQVRNDGPAAVFLGSQPSDANPVTGFKLPSGQQVTLNNTNDDVWAVAAAAVAAGASAPNHAVSFGAPGAIAAAGNGASVDTTAFGTDVDGVSIPVNVTALGVGPGQSVTLALQESEDGAAWADVTTSVVNAVGVTRLAAKGPFARFLRVAWRAVAGGGLTIPTLAGRVTTYGESAAGNAAIPQSATLHVITEYAVSL